jgi:hypothetical protein
MSSITQDMIDCWRVNYGLGDRTPEDAARWWEETPRGMAPSGAVAALGLLMQEREAMARDAERYRFMINHLCTQQADSLGPIYRIDVRIGKARFIGDAIDAAMKDAP